MSYVLVRHRVEDYEKWKSVFDEQQELRRAEGEQSLKIYQTTKDPNELIILMHWDNLENARHYFNSDSTLASFTEAGVQSPLHIRFIRDEA